MTRRIRVAMFIGAAVLVSIPFVRAVSAMPAFGSQINRYGDLVNRLSLPERHTADAVTVVNFDVRGVDTLGEEFILFSAVIGVALLLRPRREDEILAPVERALEPGGAPPALWRIAARAAIPITLVVGLEVVTHGHLTPGGGFQGGVMIGSALSTAFVLGHYGAFNALAPKSAADGIEGAAVTGFVAVGIGGLVAGAAFLANVLPLGKPLTFLSAGTIWVLNLVVGTAVGGGFVLLVADFLEQLTRVHPHMAVRRNQKDAEVEPQ
jgi:multicomponent Na+:H+ antiporter subunit B